MNRIKQILNKGWLVLDAWSKQLILVSLVLGLVGTGVSLLQAQNNRELRQLQDKYQNAAIACFSQYQNLQGPALDARAAAATTRDEAAVAALFDKHGLRGLLNSLAKPGITPKEFSTLLSEVNARFDEAYAESQAYTQVKKDNPLPESSGADCILEDVKTQ